jgi:hypothetical protein
MSHLKRETPQLWQAEAPGKFDQLASPINTETNPFITIPQARLAQRLAARLGLAASMACVLAVLALGDGGMQ